MAMAIVPHRGTVRGNTDMGMLDLIPTPRPQRRVLLIPFLPTPLPPAQVPCLYPYTRGTTRALSPATRTRTLHSGRRSSGPGPGPSVLSPFLNLSRLRYYLPQVPLLPPPPPPPLLLLPKPRLPCTNIPLLLPR